jgi:large repetitive protein
LRSTFVSNRKTCYTKRHVLGGVLRSGRTARRLAAGAVLLACAVVVVGPAGADADQAITITGPATVVEGGSAFYTISLEDGSDDDATVDVAAAALADTSTLDFSATPSKVTVKKGDSTNFTVVATGDTLDEDDTEGFTVSLSNAVRGTIEGGGSLTTRITDDDGPPEVSAFDGTEVTEGNTTINLNVVLSKPSGKQVTIRYGLGQGGTATSGADFAIQPDTLTFPACKTNTSCVTSRPIPIQIKQDALAEADETVFINLFEHTNVETGGVEKTQAKVTIKDDNDAVPKPTLSSPSINEGNSATVDLTFEASLPAPHPATTFNFRTVAGSADGSDYEIQSGSKNFPANSSTVAGAVTKVPITIKVKGDLLDELDETFKVELLTTGTTEEKVAEGMGTIKNDDNNSKLSISDATGDEPGTMEFTVTLAPVSGREVKVSWASADGTATAPSDYGSGSGLLTFAPGETTKTIDVAVAGDAINEENETLKVVLTDPTGVPPNNVTDAEGAGTIVDKNAPPTLSISDTTAREGEGATFTVTLAGTTLRTVTVRFSTADGSATAGSDYSARTGSLTFAPGEKSKSIAVTVVDDALSEPLETFAVVLDDAVNAAITKSRGSATIEASDRADAPVTPTPPTNRPTAKPTAVLVPRMILGPRLVLIGANGIAKMQVSCQKVSPIVCAGSVELERAAKPLLKLGKKTFSVKRGTKAFASIKLSARAITLLRKNKSLRVKVIVQVKTTTKTMKVSPGIITLKATTALLKAKPKSAAPAQPQVIVDP